jgi:ribosomal protein S27AE
MLLMRDPGDAAVIVLPEKIAPRRPCARCGKALYADHGNRRYHPECSTKVKAERQRRNAAAYRARRSGVAPITVPEDFSVGRVTIPGVALSGVETAAIRAAASRALITARAFQDALAPVHFRDVLRNSQLMALRGFVDDVITFVEVVDDSLPIS